MFTGGGTEADNLAVLGTVRRHGGVRGVLAPSSTTPCSHPVEHVGGRVVGVDARRRASTSTRWPPRSTTDVDASCR